MKKNSSRKLVGKIQVASGLAVLLVFIPYLYWQVGAMSESYYSEKSYIGDYLQGLNITNETSIVLSMNALYSVMNAYLAISIMQVLASSVLGVLSVVLILQGLANMSD